MRITRCTMPLGALLLAFLLLAAPGASAAQVAVSITIGPPPLPVYVQPVCPGEGFIWIPGYWAYGHNGYFWVPGVWVEPAVVGYLWTPGYWAWNDGVYVWYPGYWGPEVGFYGGIDYGFGYFGTGYVGGYWDHDRFYYNRAVNNINLTVVHYTYDRHVNRTRVRYISYNGGPDGISARPTARERAAMRTSHRPPTRAQFQQEQAARKDRALLASVNHGKPTIAATPRAGEFRGGGVVAARAAGRVAPHAAPARRSAVPERGRANRPAVPREAPKPRPSNERPSRARPSNPPAHANSRPERNQQQEMRQQGIEHQQRQQMEQRQQREQQQKHRQDKHKQPGRPSESGKPPSHGR